MIRLILASRSPARLATMRSAGIEPVVRISAVDEEALARSAGDISTAELALVLARAKADDVSAHAYGEVLVLGCDSVLEFDGTTYGKPDSADEARKRWQAMRGRSAVLHTGHWLIDHRPAEAGGTGRTVGAAASTVVHFAELTDAEIDAYVATGEPLEVAGAFTVDGLGGPFVTGIEGDHHNVVGLSLPVLRTLLADLDVSIPDLWR